MKRRFQFLYLSLSLLLDEHAHWARQLIGRRLELAHVHRDLQKTAIKTWEFDLRPSGEKPGVRESDSVPVCTTENALDPESLVRLRSFFELLDKWDQEDKADEE